MEISHIHQTALRGAIDWSWDLLEPDEQSALAQLSVFEGGFTLEAAEGVLALEDLWPMDAVQALVDAADEDRGTGGIDVVRRIFPTVIFCNEAGLVEVPEDEIEASYRRIVSPRSSGAPS